MNYFAGLDVSVKNTSVCIVDEMGKIVREDAPGEPKSDSPARSVDPVPTVTERLEVRSLSDSLALQRC
jgi:hypothetical protein